MEASTFVLRQWDLTQRNHRLNTVSTLGATADDDDDAGDFESTLIPAPEEA